ncbi:hypothetical protein RhiJN_24158 [Ceratobasidium sp. AG-Ba]|nr:hypothetical protein RhiJN_24158 [Ceratobasidium sp. AG-Ba]
MFPSTPRMQAQRFDGRAVPRAGLRRAYPEIPPFRRRGLSLAKYWVVITLKSIAFSFMIACLIYNIISARDLFKDLLKLFLVLIDTILIRLAILLIGVCCWLVQLIIAYYNTRQGIQFDAYNHSGCD